MNVALGLNINADKKDHKQNFGKEVKKEAESEFKQKAELEIKQNSHREIQTENRETGSDKSNREIDHAKLENVLSGLDFDKNYKNQE